MQEQFSTMLRMFCETHATGILLKNNQKPIFVYINSLGRYGAKLAQTDIMSIIDIVAPKFDITSNLSYQNLYDYDNNRFRVEIFKESGGLAVMLHRLSRLKTWQELSLPAELVNIAERKSGLVIIAGTNGHGRSTTLNALVHQISLNKSAIILNLAQLIETNYQANLATCLNRQLGIDTPNYATAIREGFTQKVSVFVVHEVADAETLQAMLLAVEAGHLVIGIVQAVDTSSAIEVLLSFDLNHRLSVAKQLAKNLCYVLSQRLLLTVQDRLMPVVEILEVDNSIAKHIANADLAKIAQLLAKDKLNLDSQMSQLHEKDLITYEHLTESLLDRESIVVPEMEVFYTKDFTCKPNYIHSKLAN